MKKLAFLSNRTFFLWLGEILLVLVLVGVVGWLAMVVQGVRRELVQRQLELEQSLAGAGAAAVVGNELDNKQAEIIRITKHVPTQSGIGDVVAVLEKEANQRGVSLNIPTIEEIVDEEEGAGVLRLIKMKVNIGGEPDDVLAFFHTVEHVPYLARVGEWKLLVNEATASPGDGLAPPGGPNASASLGEGSLLASLSLDLFLSIQATDSDEAK